MLWGGMGYGSTEVPLQGQVRSRGYVGECRARIQPQQ